jgi:hypothetical protein
MVLTPFLLEMATRHGRVNFLINASPLKDKIVELSFEQNLPIIASSVNLSNCGTKYTAKAIEPEV